MANKNILDGEIVDPFGLAKDDLEWLELDNIPKIDIHPFYVPSGFPMPNPVEEMVQIMSDPNYFFFTCKHLFNIELMPYQCVILEFLWRKRLPMMIASRGGSKSFMLAIYALLRLIFTPGCKIVICSASYRQSKQVFQYMVDVWQSSPILKDICGGDTRHSGPHRDVDRLDFQIGNSVCFSIPLGDGCVSPDTIMTYDNSFGYICDLIKEKDSTLSETLQHNIFIYGNGKFNKSDEVYYNGIKPTKIIKTSNGFSFEATYNHKMKILRGLDILWIRSDEMVIGDKILIDRSCRWHNGNVEGIDKEDCYAYGAILGDGSFTGRYKIGFATNDCEIVESLNKAKNTIRKDFIKASKNDPYHWNMNGAKEVDFWKKTWHVKLEKAINKKLSDVALRLPKDLMTQCMRGLFDTDGGVQISTKKGGTSVAVSFWNTSETLINQLQFILLHYGIIACKRERIRKNHEWNKEFQLLITGNDAYKFYKEIGFKLRRKQSLLDTAFSNKKRFFSYTDCVPNIKNEMIKFCIEKNVSVNKLKIRKNITRHDIKQFFDTFQDDSPFFKKLLELSDPNIYYDEIVSITDSESSTYDLHVPIEHEYCANGFFSHNSKIRGMRANIILNDEFSAIPEEIFNVVVQGFGVVQSSPVEKVKNAAIMRRLKEEGLLTPEMTTLYKLGMAGNQIVYSGTAWYDFNHFARYFKKWHKIISSKGRDESVFNNEEGIPEGFDWHDYGILRIPYTKLPKDYLDAAIVAQAKATLSHSQFMREYECIFVSDSDGFFKRSIIEAATTNKPIPTSDGKLIQFAAARSGDQERAYVIGVDPAADKDNAAISVIEMHTDHRRIVYCWTTNRKRYTSYKKEAERSGVHLDGEYYRYIAKKIRQLMRVFNTERIVMDKNGGGIAIAECLSSEDSLIGNEAPIYEIINPDEPKSNDMKVGLHILELLKPTQDLNVEANHGLLKDLQDKVLLFPKFDTVEVEKAIIKDGDTSSLDGDSYEEILEEIEELKNEMTLITVTPSSVLGKEIFDLPKTKGESAPKGYMRKDRYSALLYANYYARNKGKTDIFKIDYKPSGGTLDTLRRITPTNSSMYTGPGMLKFQNGHGKISPAVRVVKK